MTRETTPSEQVPAKFHETQQVWIKGPRQHGPHTIDEVRWINRKPYYVLDHSLAPYAEDMLTDQNPSTPTPQTE